MITIDYTVFNNSIALLYSESYSQPQLPQSLSACSIAASNSFTKSY